MLKGKEIVLGVTGGIAAYKAAEFVRLLVKQEANVHVVMTRKCSGIYHPTHFSNPFRKSSSHAILLFCSKRQKSVILHWLIWQIDRHPSCDGQYHRKDCQRDC